MNGKILVSFILYYEYIVKCDVNKLVTLSSVCWAVLLLFYTCVHLRIVKGNHSGVAYVYYVRALQGQQLSINISVSMTRSASPNSRT